jgi:hypothetical protein
MGASKVEKFLGTLMSRLPRQLQAFYYRGLQFDIKMSLPPDPLLDAALAVVPLPETTNFVQSSAVPR